MIKNSYPSNHILRLIVNSHQKSVYIYFYYNCIFIYIYHIQHSCCGIFGVKYWDTLPTSCCLKPYPTYCTKNSAFEKVYYHIIIYMNFIIFVDMFTETKIYENDHNWFNCSSFGCRFDPHNFSICIH